MKKTTIADNTRQKIRRTAAMALAGTMLASLYPITALAGCNYCDNDIVFTEQTNYNILSGNFRVWDYKVTPGQDPDRNYSIGQDVYMVEEKDGVNHFRFQVGRCSDKYPATYWNTVFNPSNAIHGDAEELNFYFFGEMNLRVANEKTNAKYDITFEQIGFAQGVNEQGETVWHFGQVRGKCSDNASLNVHGIAQDEQGEIHLVQARYQISNTGASGSPEFILCDLNILD